MEMPKNQPLLAQRIELNQIGREIEEVVLTDKKRVQSEQAPIDVVLFISKVVNHIVEAALGGIQEVYGRKLEQNQEVVQLQNSQLPASEQDTLTQTVEQPQREQQTHDFSFNPETQQEVSITSQKNEQHDDKAHFANHINFMNYIYPLHQTDMNYNSKLFKDEDKDMIDISGIVRKETPFDIGLRIKECVRETNKIVYHNENNKTYNKDMVQDITKNVQTPNDMEHDIINLADSDDEMAPYDSSEPEQFYSLQNKIGEMRRETVYLAEPKVAQQKENEKPSYLHFNFDSPQPLMQPASVRQAFQ